VFGGAHAFTMGQLVPFVQDGSLSYMSAEVIAGGVGGGFQVGCRRMREDEGRQCMTVVAGTVLRGWC
jgi:hypothetical protein